MLLLVVDERVLDAGQRVSMEQDELWEGGGEIDVVAGRIKRRICLYTYQLLSS